MCLTQSCDRGISLHTIFVLSIMNYINLFSFMYLLFLLITQCISHLINHYTNYLSWRPNVCWQIWNQLVNTVVSFWQFITSVPRHIDRTPNKYVQYVNHSATSVCRQYWINRLVESDLTEEVLTARAVVVSVESPVEDGQTLGLLMETAHDFTFLKNANSC